MTHRWLVRGSALALLLAGCGGPSVAPSSEGAAFPTLAASEAPSAAASAQPSAVPGEWEVLAPAPFARIEAASAPHDGAIWLAGGLNEDGSASDETWRFDPAAGTWTPGPNLPQPMHHAAMVSTGDDLLLIGGYEGSTFSNRLDSVLRLSDASDAWEPTTPLPERRAAGAAAWDGSRVVYAGGVGEGGLVSDGILALDGERWSSLGEMAGPREHVSAASDGEGRTWILGGRQITLDTNVATIEYVEDDLVALIGHLPTGRGGAVAFHLPGIGACLAGGERLSNALDDVECVGADRAIVELPPLAEPRHGHSAAVLDGTVYVLLGGPEPLLTVSDTVQALPLTGP